MSDDNKQHFYTVDIRWTGNTGNGTKTYAGYKRDHEIAVVGKSPIAGSSDPSFRGDKTRYNPEELLVAALSACHMLWFLHLSVVAGLVVVEYEDRASGTMVETQDGGGYFTDVTLYPVVKALAHEKATPELSTQLHERAHELCFIAKSVNFRVTYEPSLELLTS